MGKMRMSAEEMATQLQQQAEAGGAGGEAVTL